MHARPWNRASSSVRHPLAALALAALALAAAAFAPACGGCSDSAEIARENELAMQRERGVALWEEDRLEDALVVLLPLAERADGNAADLVRAACTLLDLARHDQARPLLERARALSPDDPAVLFNLARTYTETGDDFALGLQLLQRTLELAPDDVPTRLELSELLAGEARDEEAAVHADAVIARGVDQARGWILIALYQRSRIAFNAGRDEEGHALQRQSDELEHEGLVRPDSREAPRGWLGVLRPPAPPRPPDAPPVTQLEFESAPTVSIPLDGLRGVVACDLSIDMIPRDERTDAKKDLMYLIAWPIGAPDLVAWGPTGAWVLERDATDAAWAHRRIAEGDVAFVRTFDLERDGDQDLWMVVDGALVLYEQRDGGFVRSEIARPELPGPPTDLAPLDYDHEGDIDVLLVGAFGWRIWRNESRAPDLPEGSLPTTKLDDLPRVDPRFTDASAGTGLPAAGALTWCAVEDFDTDQDVDFACGGPGARLLADSQRQERFADRSADLPAAPATDAEPWIADFDRDGRPDLLWGGATSRLHSALPSGRYAPGAERGVAPIDPATGALVDADLDGFADLLGPSESRLAEGLLSAGTEAEAALELADAVACRAVACADFDGDSVPDLARLTDRGVDIHRGKRGAGRGFRLSIQGTKDNSRGVGAVVEVRGERIYRRMYWRGEPELIGVGADDGAALVRVTWPNGIRSHGVDVAGGRDWVIVQRDKTGGSCPLVYAWNGTTYQFVTDVLGITPLGLPMAPGMLVPPDHDEYVLVSGDVLVPRKGADGRPELALQFTEELRELTYLDRVRLDVIDHPAEVEVFPNERFTFPPFPEPHVHSVADPLAPTRALASDGRDWAAELAGDDWKFAAPFLPYRWTDGGQFLGLATPHWIELEFDPERVRAAQKLRLVMTGWFYWTDASVNMAAARTEDVRFVPPMLELQDEQGRWQPVGPPLGFPAGMLKTMVVDVTDRVPRERPRFRISSTLLLYWDSIRLAVDADDGERRSTSLEPSVATLYERGFSRRTVVAGELKMSWFDWDQREEFPSWDQHPGLYTRFGDVRPLLGGIDDMFVILGAGDAIDLRFDASSLPPLPSGWKRDYLLFLDGWAKDRDPNTIEALYVEPLPFHGMSGYPYRADEKFPDDEEHRKWRAEWNTRPTKRWVESLAPTRSAQSAP